MADLHHIWYDVFQAPGTLTWRWLAGEREHYWGFSVRPFQANESGAEILRQFTSSDNDLRHTQHLVVRVASGNLYRFSAIWVVGG
jgi:hypothetical protein